MYDLFITRKKFDRIRSQDVDSVLMRPMSSVPKRLLQRIKSSIGDYSGDLRFLAHPEFYEVIDITAEETSAISAPGQPFDYEAWMTLHDILLLRMRLVEAYKCRLNATAIMTSIAEYVLKDLRCLETLTPLEFTVIASWVAESGIADLRVALQRQYRILSKTKRQQFRGTFRGFVLYEGNIAKYRRLTNITLRSESDQRYAEYLLGKRVAIAGPVNVGLENGLEIDASDAVVRFNHHDNSPYRELEHGRRTDVSYYTNPAFKRFVIGKNCRLSGLKYAIPQSTSILATEEQRVNIRAEVRGQYRRSNSIIYKSHGNALQRMLLDISRFHSHSVKVFNLNLWLTSHSKDYHAGRPQVDPHMFLVHDPVSNFQFTKRMAHLGIIEVDSELDKVLALDVDTYVRKIDLIYGKNFRDQQNADH